VAEDRRPCRNPDCDETIAANLKSDFCFGCTSQLHLQSAELLGDIDRTLALEAEFIKWCADNGHPHPHT